MLGSEIPPPDCLREGEQFRLVPFDGRYCVSDDGRVFSRAKRGRQGRQGGLVATWREMKPTVTIAGYLVVGLGGKTHFVHHLVLVAFVGEPGPKEECRHLNGIRSDARLANLKWGSRVENHADKITHGTDASGERNSGAKLTNVQADLCRQLWARHPPYSGVGSFIARWFGISQQSSSQVCLGKTYKAKSQ